MTRTTLCLAVIGVVPLVCALAGCMVGPASITAGRGVYNEVINRTEDEQLLNMIVRDRYNETYGMLGVASVTANIRARANVRTEFGLSRSLKEDYGGNLVPLGAGIAYEDNPTISYIPLGGEEFVQRLLSPLTIEETLLMAQYVRHWRKSYMNIGISSINGLHNRHISNDDREIEKFSRVAYLWRRLQREGVLRIGRDQRGDFQAVFSLGDSEHEEVMEELLELTQISKRPSGGLFVVPVRLAAEGWSEDSFNFETPSILGILRAAGACIEIPAPHLEAGVVEPVENKKAARFMRIRTSRVRPDGEGAVAVRYRGWWYYVDDADPDSKQGFLFLRMLVGLRLYKPAQDRIAPVLTIPVG